jgi:CheY-like chemotaxis protein
MASTAVLEPEKEREILSPAPAPVTARPRSVVICSPATLATELYGTVLARGDVARRNTRRAEEAIALMLAEPPDLLVVDERLPEAETLVAAVRLNPVTRPVSIVVVAADDFDPRDLRFLLAGANAILRLPANPDWDERLEVLLDVPPRREARLAVSVEYQIEIFESVQAIAGTAVNVSETGMLLETDVPLPVGIDVDFRIHLADGRPAPLIGCGQLVRQDGKRSGVRFYGLEHDGAERLRRFCVR